jgi:hypothetical protein
MSKPGSVTGPSLAEVIAFTMIEPIEYVARVQEAARRRLQRGSPWVGWRVFDTESGVLLTCASHTQEILRSNPDTRSDASQRLRNSDDSFYKDTATVGDWELFWGRKQGKIETAKTNDRLVKSSIGVK